MVMILVLTYFVLPFILFAWAWKNAAFTPRFKESNRWFWWLILLVFPIVGPIVYFQTKKRKVFNPTFNQRR